MLQYFSTVALTVHYKYWSTVQYYIFGTSTCSGSGQYIVPVVLVQNECLEKKRGERTRRKNLQVKIDVRVHN
jgi:hypothetical protein